MGNSQEPKWKTNKGHNVSSVISQDHKENSAKITARLASEKYALPFNDLLFLVFLAATDGFLDIEQRGK